MNRARQVVVVAVMATALCADRGVGAAVPGPVGGGQSGEFADLAGRLVGRLAAGFVRARTPGAVAMERHVGRPEVVRDVGVCAADRGEVPRGESWSPFQFRLPPPAGC